MIDEYDKNVYYLSCDICGVSEAGPFETFFDAVQHKKDNPEDWRSLRLRDSRTGKTEWQDVCKGCLPKTALGTWKTLPDSKGLPSKYHDRKLAEIGAKIGKVIQMTPKIP